MRLKAFTLIELLLVVGIIGILAGVVIAIINPDKIRGRARDGVRKSDISVIKGAIELYYAEHNTYPETGSFTFGEEWTDTDGSVVYMRVVPSDPQRANDPAYPDYCYQKFPAGDYILCAQVEDENSASVPAGSTPCGGFASSSAHCVVNPF